MKNNLNDSKKGTLLRKNCVYGNSLRWVYAFTYNPKDFERGAIFPRAIFYGVAGNFA